ncbi:hypothetical protein [Mesorhizobium sp. Root172]|uniref:hypothetical protein n=1 Tax=Mesorhizobium sp. Root172 TaxID=1736481 RepID=UPI000AF25A05|nr:hypothetical protein [Mesorhizobium sp. Root172]
MTETFLASNGQLAYRKYVPNRTALGIPMTAKAEGGWITLPAVSILALSKATPSGAEQQ